MNTELIKRTLWIDAFKILKLISKYTNKNPIIIPMNKKFKLTIN